MRVYTLISCEKYKESGTSDLKFTFILYTFQMVDDKKKGSIDGDLISVPMCPSALKIYKIIGNKNYQVRYSIR